MSTATRGRIHFVSPMPLKIGGTSILVGAKRWGGDAVLVTLDPDSGNGGLVEIAIAPDQIEGFVARLTATAKMLGTERGLS